MWDSVKLEDLFKIGSSKRVLKAEWKDSGVPFYRGREITTLSKSGAVDNDLFISEEHFSKLKANHGVPQSGDLLVTAIGTIGNTYIVREQDRFYFKDASVLWLQKISDVDIRFVNYWFKSSLFYSQLEVGNGATVDTLSISKLKAMNFLLPPLAEQQRTVAKLDAVFAEIDRAVDVAINRESELEALKRGALDNYFQSLKNEKKMGDVFEFVRGPFGGSLKKSVFVAEGFAVYEQQHAIKDQCREFRYYVPREKFDEMSRFRVSPNSILMSCSGTIGKTTIIPTSFTEGIINQALLMLRPSEKVLPKFATLYMESKRFSQQLMERVEGAAQKNVASVKVLKEILIPLPRIEEQQKLVSDIETILSEIDVTFSITESIKDNYIQLKSAILAQELQPSQGKAA